MTLTRSELGRAAPGLGIVAILTLVAFAVSNVSSSLSPLVAGVLLGALVGNITVPSDRLMPGVTFAARRLLRIGVVLLGFRLAMSDLVDLGARGLVVVAMVVTITFFGTQWVGRRLGLSSDLSLLVATGYSICGASAVAAVDGVINADEEETAYAVALVTLFGSLSIVALPLLAVPLGLEGAEFGAWVGGSVHDVAQVVAAAATDGEDASNAAIVVKLTRVVLLAPLVALVAIRRRTTHPIAGDVARPPIVPLFVACFLVAIAIRSSDVLADDWLATIKDGEKLLLTMALVGLGIGVRFSKLRQLGGRPLVLGLISWFLVAAVSYAGVRITGI